MPRTWTKFLLRWLITTVAVLVAAKLVSGIHYKTLTDLFVASLVIGILNAFLRPVLMLFSRPFLIFTFGLFTFVVNGIVLYIAGKLLAPHFVLDGFGPAFWAAIVISIVTMILNGLTGVNRKSEPPPQNKPKPPPDTGGGPIIDV